MKRLLLFLTMALTLFGVGRAETYTLELTAASLGLNTTSYAANNGDHTVTAKSTSGKEMDVTINTYQQMIQSQAWQWQKSAAYLYNKTDLKNIKSVSITSTEGSYTVYEGTNENPSSSSVTSTNGVYNFSENNGFLKIAVGSVLGKVSNITITFEIEDQTGGGGETPTPGGETKTATFTYSENNKGNAVDIEDVTINNVTFDFEKGTSNNPPKYYDTGESARVYNGNTLTISVPDGYKLKSISFSCNDSKGSFNFNINGSTASNPWTTQGDIQSVTYTAGATVYIQSITVTYEDDGNTETPKQEAGISFPAKEYSATLGTNFESPKLTNDNGLQVTYTSSQPSVATINDKGVVSLVAGGTTVITATTPEDDTYKAGEASYTLTVTDPNDIHTDITPIFFNYITNSYAAVTQKDEFNVTYSAVYLGSNSQMQFNTNNASGKGSGVAVSGINKDYIITSIDIEMNDNNNGLDVYIKTDDEGFEELKTTSSPNPNFRKQVNNVKNSTSGIQINAYAFEVVPASGGAVYVQKITVHYQKVENTDKTPEISFAEENVSVSITEKDTYKGQTLTNDENLNVVYSSSNQEVATVDESTGEVTLVNKGQTTISAKATGNEGYKELTVSYTLTVTPDPNAPIVDVIELKNFNQAGLGSGQNASYTFTTWTSPESGITFAMGSRYSEANNDDKFDLRSSSNSGLVVNENPNGLYLDKIIVEVPSGNASGKALNIYTNEQGYAFTQASDFNDMGGVKLTETLDCSTEGSPEQIINETPQFWGLKSVSGYLSVNKIYFYYTKTPRIDAELSFTPEKLEVTLGDDSFELPVLTNEKEVTVKYTSSDEDVATVNPETGELELLTEGNTTITATVDPIAEYFGSASYELVILPNLDAEKQEIIWGSEGYAYDDASDLEDFTEYPVSYDFERGTHTNTSPKYYVTDTSARFYAGNTFTISVPRNYELVRILLMNTNTSNKDFALENATNGNLSKDENEAKWTPTEGEPVHETTFTFSGVTRVHEMVVYYKKIFDIEDITLTSGIDIWDIMWEQTSEFEGIAMTIISDPEADLSDIAENNLKFELKPTWGPSESVEGQSDVDGDFSADGEFIYEADESTLLIETSCSGLYELVVSIKDKNVPYTINGEDSLVIGTANIYPAFGGIKLSYASNETDEKNENFGKAREFTQDADGNLNYEFEADKEGEIYENCLTPKVEIETGEGVEIWYQIHGLDNVLALNANKRRAAATDLDGLGFTKVEDGTINLTPISELDPTDNTKQVSIVLAKNGANTPISNLEDDTDNKSAILINLVKSDNYVTFIESIFGEVDGEVEYYTLDGIKVKAENLQNGLYIVKNGKKAVKVLISK